MPETKGQRSVYDALVLLLAAAFDLIGEPAASVHPVVWYGRLIRALESRAPRGQGARLRYGVIMLLVAFPLVLVPAKLFQGLIGSIEKKAKDYGGARVGLLASAVFIGMALKPFFALRMLVEDLLNLFPARLSALLIIACAPLFGALQGLGFRVVLTRTHYALIHVGNARQLRETLLQGGLLVRDCTSFGLPQYIRVATRQEHEWSRLAGALRVLQSEEKELWEN